MIKNLSDYSGIKLEIINRKLENVLIVGKYII